jgi:hypothetical protein
MIKPPPFTSEDIVARAEVFVDEFTRILGGKRELVRNGLQFDRVYEEVIYPNYGIGLDEKTDLGFDEAGRKIIGYFEPGENKAYIDISLRKDPRREFTRWHEVAGHGILQGAWLRKLMSRGVTTEDDLSPDTINVLERQANLFGANAAAPLWLVDAMIVRVFRPTKPFFYPGPCGYWLDANGWPRQYHIFSFDELCQTIAWKLQPYFGYLSKEALGYRVRETGWVFDITKASLKLFRKAKSAGVRRVLVPA